MNDTVNYSYFPTKYQAVIFRNWGSVEASRIAETIRTTEETVRACAADMGLDPNEPCNPLWRSRGYVTIIRQNWYLLPEEQILTLLDWTAEKYAFSLKEDDFLYYKLGRVPKCESVYYAPLTEKQKAQTRWLRGAVQRAAQHGKQTPFAFLQELSEPEHLTAKCAREAKSGEVLIDNSWCISTEAEDVSFAVSRFARRIRERWGISLSGTAHTISLRIIPKGKHRRETHMITVEDENVLIESVDAFGLMRGLSYLEECFEKAEAPVLSCGRNAREELALVYSHIDCCAKDSRIGFEASNHYFYNRQTLLEAAVSCEYVIEKTKK